MGRHFFASMQCGAYHEYFGLGLGRAKGSNQNPQGSNSPGEGHYVLKIYQGSYFSRGQAGAGRASLLD